MIYLIEYSCFDKWYIVLTEYDEVYANRALNLLRGEMPTSKFRITTKQL